MADIPDDLNPILREIDNALKAEGVPPDSRGMRAVVEFGKRFHICLPLVEIPPGAPIPPDAPPELRSNSAYTKRIHDWFAEVYDEREKVDFSSRAKVAVLADSDIWEMRIPLIRGTAIVTPSRELPSPPDRIFSTSPAPIRVNPCSALLHITAARLAHFSDDDLNEVYAFYVMGLDVRAVYDRFRKDHQLFVESETDWASAVFHLTAQSPNHGHSRWATQQMCEKFMKGLIEVIGEGNPKQRHDLEKLHDELAKSIQGLNLKHLIADVSCTDKVRYGEVPSTREQAYTAHKSALLLVRTLGSVRNVNA